MKTPNKLSKDFYYWLGTFGLMWLLIAAALDTSIAIQIYGKPININQLVHRIKLVK